MSGWFESLKKWALAHPYDAPVDLPLTKKVDTSHSMVKAPVIGFVKTVKANPRRFRCRLIQASSYEQRNAWKQGRSAPDQYTFTDKFLGHQFTLHYASGSLYSVVSGIDFSLNGWELKYLHEELLPIFTAARQRANRMEALRVTRQRIEGEIMFQQRRNRWTSIYGE